MTQPTVTTWTPAPGVRQLLAERRPHQWISRDGGTPHLRSGHPFSPADAARLTGAPFTAGECPECGRDRWVAWTDVRDATTPREKIRDLLLCRSCGHQRPDDREEIHDE
jgi:hypothetical protein